MPLSDASLARSEDCPPAERLKAFLVGALPEPDLVQVAEHCGSCSQCSSRLQSLSDADDDVVRALRGARPFGDASDTSAFEPTQASEKEARTARLERPRQAP